MKIKIELAKQEVEHALVEYLHRKGYKVMHDEIKIDPDGSVTVECTRPEAVSEESYDWRYGPQ